MRLPVAELLDTGLNSRALAAVIRVVAGWRTLAAAVLLSACARHAAPTAGETAAASSRVEWYRQGHVRVLDARCDFVPADSAAPMPFQCGEIIVTLRDALRASSVADLVTALDAIVLRDRSGQPDGWLLLRVAPGTEREAVLRAYADPRVSAAHPNWNGISVRTGHTPLNRPGFAGDSGCWILRRPVA